LWEIDRIESGVFMGLRKLHDSEPKLNHNKKDALGRWVDK